jgi:hypothetical protein
MRMARRELVAALFCTAEAHMDFAEDNGLWGEQGHPL